MLPNESEAVWRLADSVSVYVVEDKERAGRGLLTIAVDDLDRAVTKLHERGTRATMDEAHVPRRAIVRDGDGNTITFFAV
jgi:predicted enzyme related to lactoylglutathione lyase